MHSCHLEWLLGRITMGLASITISASQGITSQRLPLAPSLRTVSLWLTWPDKEACLGKRYMTSKTTYLLAQKVKGKRDRPGLQSSSEDCQLTKRLRPAPWRLLLLPTAPALLHGLLGTQYGSTVNHISWVQGKVLTTAMQESPLPRTNQEDTFILKGRLWTKTDDYLTT